MVLRDFSSLVFLILFPFDVLTESLIFGLRARVCHSAFAIQTLRLGLPAVDCASMCQRDLNARISLHLRDYSFSFLSRMFSGDSAFQFVGTKKDQGNFRDKNL